MSNWFYVTADRQQHGPLSTDELIASFHSGKIVLTTPVWREGEPEWRRLSDFSNELGLPASDSMGTAPPPLPPAAQAPVSPAVADTPATAPPRKGLSGCAIAAIIGAVIVIVIVPVVAILAAIALPAYQDYAVRSKVSTVLAAQAEVKTTVTAFVHENNRCPTDNDKEVLYLVNDTTRSSPVLYFEEAEDRCIVEMPMSFSNPSALRGKTIWLDFNLKSRQWECRSNIDDRYLPPSCQG